MRGQLLRYWEPDGPVDDGVRRRWTVAAERIAAGVVELAHLDPFVDAAHLRVGFSCDGDTGLAKTYVAAILGENIEARQVAPIVPPRAGAAPPADEVVLPCRPDAPDEEIRHAVLAALKASHALEFVVEHENRGGTPVDGSPSAKSAEGWTSL